MTLFVVDPAEMIGPAVDVPAMDVTPHWQRTIPDHVALRRLVQPAPKNDRARWKRPAEPEGSDR